MLILTRRHGESIIVGDNVRITVISVKGNQVRIGVEAPRSVSVQRQEIAGKKDPAQDNDLEKVPEKPQDAAGD